LPADIALSEGHKIIAEMLDPVYRCFIVSNTDSLISFLTIHPELINHKNVRGRTSLHLAFIFDQDELVDDLTEQGADPGIKDLYGNLPQFYSKVNRDLRTGINEIEPTLARETDDCIIDEISKYDHINVGLTIDGRVVFTRSYGKNVLDKTFAWGSVSKGATMILLHQLLEEGKITSFDDEIWDYSSRYRDCMPDKYENIPLTIRNLMLHTSGVPHNDQPTWTGSKLNLKFEPGTQVLYSTPGYGIIGHIIEDITGMTYPDAVIKYIAEPVNAKSVWVEDHFRAPAARINSSIYDFALFACGIMNNSYIREETLYENIFITLQDEPGLGWPCKNVGTDDLITEISGSNGIPQAHMVIKPRKKYGVVLLAHTKNRHSFELNTLGEQIFNNLENYINNEAIP